MQVLKLVLLQKVRGVDMNNIDRHLPDVVCPVLKTQGLTPTAGFGNPYEVVPKIQWLAARKLGVHPGELQVRLVAHHALEKGAFCQREGKQPPHYLKLALRMPWI